VKRKKSSSVSSISNPANTISHKVYYPVFLSLKDKKTVIIGGGSVAERKVLSLLKSGADITVISPEITEKIGKEKLRKRIRHISRHYRKGDLRNAFLVIAATDSPVINDRVSKDALCLVNVVDTPDLCNFIVPSTMVRGPLTFAVSSSGVSPALSKSIRREIEKMYGTEFSRYLESLRKIRAEAMDVIGDQRKRSRLFKALASEKAIKMLRDKGYRETIRAAEDLFEKVKTDS